MYEDLRRHRFGPFFRTLKNCGHFLAARKSKTENRKKGGRVHPRAGGFAPGKDPLTRRAPAMLGDVTNLPHAAWIGWTCAYFALTMHLLARCLIRYLSGN
jgi:hypothetical protein